MLHLRARRLAIAVSLAGLGIALGARPCAGQTTWTGAVGSGWGVAGNWSAGVPTAAVDAVIPAGTPNAPSTAGAVSPACRDLTVSAGATLDVAPGTPLSVNRAASIPGSVGGGGLLRFVGSTGGTVTATGTIGANVEIAKSGGALVTVGSSWTVTGDLLQTSGIFSVAQSNLHTVSVAGNATFAGGTLQPGSLTGTIDVAGDVTFSGTAVTITPTIRCAGNWTSNPPFTGTGGSVHLDGTTPQTISGAGALPHLTIAATASVTRTGAMTLAGTLTLHGSLAHSGGTLAIGGAATIDGTLSMPSSTLDANSGFTVAATGTVNLGGGTHTFGANYSASGSVMATGLFVFDSSSGGTVFGSAPLPSVQISKSGGALLSVLSSWTVNGGLTLTSGTFNVAQAPTSTVSVAGDATFTGGVLAAPSAGTLDVAGNVTFSGTSVPSLSPTIRCGGTWTSDAAYAPMAGIVVLDGVGAQTIVGSGTLPGLTIVATSSATRIGAMTLAGNLVLDGSLAHSGGPLAISGNATINGTLSMPSSALDVNGAFTVAASGSADLGGGAHTFGGNYAASGTVIATGLFVFDSNIGANIFGNPTFPSVQISKSSGTILTVLSSWTVNGDLTLTSGSFYVSQAPTYVVSVSGNATFSGGTLGAPSAGTIDVAGDVTFAGTTVTTLTPTIRCGGTWTSDAAYAPPIGNVVLDGVGAQAIVGSALFPSLTIAATSSATRTGAMPLAGNLILDGSLAHSGGPLVINGTGTINGTLSMPSSTLDANGSFTVAASGSVNLGAGTHTFGANYTGAGTVTATGLFVFDSPIGGLVAGPAPFPSVEIAKSAGATLGVNSSLTVNGNLTLTSGGLLVAQAAAYVVSVLGSATFAGGTLGVTATGTLDVEGDVTFSGTTTSFVVPTIRCGGDWSSDAGWIGPSGTIELDGTAPTTFTSTTGTLQTGTLKIRNGVRSASPGLAVSASTITVESTGTLAVGPFEQLVIHRPAGPTALTLQGVLTLVEGSELALGPQTSATVAASGLLSLIGFVDQPAKLVGTAGGGYALTINGTIAAKNFLMKEMGAGGVLINAAATLAAPPNDLRGGTFDFRAGATAGSVLLDVRRAAPADIRYATFLNTPGAAGVFNVKTIAASAPVSLTNWTGAFSGASFENDPNNLIAWNAPQVTAPAFSVLPGAELSEITWSGLQLVDYAEFALKRASSPAGPWTLIFSTSTVDTSYGWIDQPLAPNQPYYYELHERLTHDAWIVIATGSSTPYSSAPPPNVYKVGAGGPYASIQAAINAATSPVSVVWVTPGTYAPFAIGASAPSNLRIVGDGTGPITINTAAGAIQIANVPATSGIEIGDLTIGSAGTAQSAIVITNSLCPVVLDELTVASAPSHAAISVSGSPGVAIQRCHVSGGPGVLVAASSYVALSKGSLSSLVSTGSTIEATDLVPGSVNVTPAGSLIAHAGLMPSLVLPEFPRLSYSASLVFDGFPGAPVILVVTSRLGFLTVSPVVEMPILLDLGAPEILPALPTDPAGHFQLSFELPPVAGLLGSSYVIQAAVVNPLNGAFRLSNVASMVALP